MRTLADISTTATNALREEHVYMWEKLKLDTPPLDVLIIIMCTSLPSWPFLTLLYLEALNQDVETGLDPDLTFHLSATQGTAHHFLVTGLWPSIKRASAPVAHITAV